MIAWIRGLVVSQHGDHVVVDVNGIGYRVFVPSPIANALGSGEEVTFHVHTQVREDAFHLFGFAETTDREVFRALTTVSGIGPKLAMNIMSYLGGVDSTTFTSKDWDELQHQLGILPLGLSRIELQVLKSCRF